MAIRRISVEYFVIGLNVESVFASANKMYDHLAHRKERGEWFNMDNISVHIKKYGMAHDFENFPISGMNYKRDVCRHVAQIAPTLYLLMKLFVLLVLI